MTDWRGKIAAGSEEREHWEDIERREVFERDRPFRETFAAAHGLDAEALQELEQALYNPRWAPRAMSLEHCISKWRHVVAEVETGYTRHLDYYSFDVDIRELLEELMVRAPGARAALTEALEPYDRRFLVATRHTDDVWFKTTSQEYDRWWAMRIPLLILPELRQSLEDQMRRHRETAANRSETVDEAREP